MTASWGSELTELIPLALVVAISPLSIIPAVLVLHTPRPKPTSLAYLAGWIFGLAALTAIFVEVSSLLGGLNKAPPWAPWVRIVIGIARSSACWSDDLPRQGSNHVLSADHCAVPTRGWRPTS